MSSRTSGVDYTPGGWTWPDDIPAYSSSDEAESTEPYFPADEIKPESPSSDSAAQPEYEDQDEDEIKDEPRTIDPDFQKHWLPRTCRICLEQVQPSFHIPNETLPGFLAGQPYVTYESESGRLIRPCKCKGSSRYVHEQCLQQWRHADRSYTSARNFFQCPTCGFRYRLQRLTWARYISSAGKTYLQLNLNLKGNY